MANDRSTGDQPMTAADDGHQTHPVRTLARLLAKVVFVYAVIIEITLLIGFVCLLFGLEPSTWLAEWIYRSVERTMQPFRGIYTAIEFGTGGTAEVEPVVEGSLLFAMVVYGIIALAAHDLLDWIGRPRRE
jgi:hypothetical protein